MVDDSGVPTLSHVPQHHHHIPGCPLFCKLILLDSGACSRAGIVYVCRSGGKFTFFYFVVFVLGAVYIVAVTTTATAALQPATMILSQAFVAYALNKRPSCTPSPRAS